MINSMTRSLITAKKYYRNMLAGNDAFNPGSFDLISTTTLGSSQSSVTFDVTGLGSTYKHLQIRFSARCDTSDTFTIIRFNSDTGANYFHQQLGGDGSSVFSSNNSSLTYMLSSSLANDVNSYTGNITDILDPFSTTKNKTIKSFGGFKDSSISKIILRSGTWASTSAATSVTCASYTGNFTSGSRFSIYGIKG